MIPRDLQIDHKSGKPLKHSGLQPNFQKGVGVGGWGGVVLTGPQLLEGGFWEREGDFFRGVAIFT